MPQDDRAETSAADNEPISFDDHGDIPFTVPFRSIDPTDISIYLQLNTRVGKSTCRQACAHCFFINQPQASNRSVDLTQGRAIADDLALLGYKIFPMISDSFANGGEFIRLFGKSHNRDYRESADRRPTKTMVRGELWTSGAPLLDDNFEELLCLAVEHGFGSITITFHGIVSDELDLLSVRDYPIARVFPGQYCEIVIRQIDRFNHRMNAGCIDRLQCLPLEERKPLQINLGVTIGAHNRTREHLLNYVRYFNRRPVSVVRFNCFHDHGGRHAALSLSPDQVAKVYADLKWIHTNVALRFQLGVDEDFGTSGIEVMGFPRHTGWCRAGRQLFAVVPDPPVLIADSFEERLEAVGSIAACVDAFKPIVGRLVRVTTKADGRARHHLDFFGTIIDELNRKRIDGTYSDGCFAPEMLAASRTNHPPNGDPTKSRHLEVLGLNGPARLSLEAVNGPEQRGKPQLHQLCVAKTSRDHA